MDNKIIAVNFLIKNDPRTIDSICKCNFPAKVITILSNKYENILTHTQSEQMSQDGIIICGSINDIPSIMCINTNKQENELFEDLNNVFNLTFSFSDYYFISKYPFLLFENSIQKLLSNFDNENINNFIGFVYSNYIQYGNIIFNELLLNNLKFFFLNKDTIAKYKLYNIDLIKNNQKINIHIPESLIEILDG